MLQFKMTKSFTNVWTYIGIIFIFSIFTMVLSQFGDFLTEQNTNGVIDLPILENYSKYTLGLNASESEVEDPVAFKYNTTESTPKDYSIPFLFSQDKSSGIRGKIQFVYSIPSSFLEILGLPSENFSDLVNAIFWLFAIGMFIAMIYFIRAVVT
jgi:hypothetical protein